MSLVGTRPPTVDEWEKYELHHRSRMSTKPGMEGSGIFKYTDKGNGYDGISWHIISKRYLKEMSKFWIWLKPADGKR